MRRLMTAGFLCAVAAQPAFAESGSARPAEPQGVEKLPVDLPELEVIGHEIRPDVNLGSKLAPGASASVAVLPAPPPARATTELLDRLRLSVPDPPDAVLDPGTPVDRDPYTSMWGGLGSLPLGHLGSYDAGFHHGRRVGPLWSLTDVSVNLHGLDRWSSMRASEQLAWDDRTSALLAWRREQQDGSPAASAVQESGKFATSFGREALALDVQGEVGRVSAIGIPTAGDVVAYGVTARADIRPESLWDGHLVEVGLDLGQLGAAGAAPGSGWTSSLLAVTASDRFRVVDRVALAADVGVSLFRQATYLDPGLRVEFRPGESASPDVVSASPTELWAAASTQTRQPGFDELYLSRLRTVGNADLRPQRVQPRVEVGAGHRLNDRAYASATAAVSQSLDHIHYAPAGDGLWQPRNFGSWQTVYDAALSAQYLFSDAALQKFSLSWNNPAGLGERTFSAGTWNESRHLDDRLALIAGMTVDYVELGPSQGGGQGLDLRADWEAAWRVESGWKLFVAGKDWHVFKQEPSAGYFAKPAQITAGLELDF